jgi:drug/metabolite transporter (DMT)-like permease
MQADGINRPMNAREWTMLLVLSAIWGCSFFFTAIMLREVSPFTSVFLRVAIGASVLVPLIHLMGHRFPRDRRAWLAFFSMALTNNVIPFALIAWGQTHIASGLAAILNATTPLWTVLVAHVGTSDEKISADRLAGVALGITGVAWMIGGDALNTLGSNVAAQIAVLLAALFYAFSGVYAKRFERMQVPPIVTAAGLLTASSTIMLPIVLLVDRPWLLPPPSMAFVGAALGMGVFATGIAYILYFRILATAGATNLLLVTLLIPVGAVLLGTRVLHERLEVKHFVGMALIAAGLAAIDGRILKRLRGRRT